LQRTLPTVLKAAGEDQQRSGQEKIEVSAAEFRQSILVLMSQSQEAVFTVGSACRISLVGGEPHRCGARAAPIGGMVGQGVLCGQQQVGSEEAQQKDALEFKRRPGCPVR
jgi:hypothetical protein